MADFCPCQGSLKLSYHRDLSRLDRHKEGDTKVAKGAPVLNLTRRPGVGKTGAQEDIKLCNAKGVPAGLAAAPAGRSSSFQALPEV